MHHFIKICVLICCLGLCACASDCRIEYIDRSYNTDSQSVSLKIPQVKGLSDSAFQTELNCEIEEICTEFLDKFRSSANELAYPSAFSAETASYSHSGFLSLVTQIDYYTKKPHNNSFRITKNVDTDLSRCIRLNNLFADDSYIDFLNDTMKKIVSDNPDNYSDLWAKPQLSENQDFYITEEHLVLYFPPYELSYYSRGFVEFFVPLKSLSGYLNEDYRNKFLKKS